LIVNIIKLFCACILGGGKLNFAKENFGKVVCGYQMKTWMWSYALRFYRKDRKRPAIQTQKEQDLRIINGKMARF
jgi:hypothetical protein